MECLTIVPYDEGATESNPEGFYSWTYENQIVLLGLSFSLPSPRHPSPSVIFTCNDFDDDSNLLFPVADSHGVLFTWFATGLCDGVLRPYLGSRRSRRRGNQLLPESRDWRGVKSDREGTRSFRSLVHDFLLSFLCVTCEGTPSQWVDLDNPVDLDRRSILVTSTCCRSSSGDRRNVYLDWTDIPHHDGTKDFKLLTTPLIQKVKGARQSQSFKVCSPAVETSVGRECRGLFVCVL